MYLNRGFDKNAGKVGACIVQHFWQILANFLIATLIHECREQKVYYWLEIVDIWWHEYYSMNRGSLRTSSDIDSLLIAVLCLIYKPIFGLAMLKV